MTMRRDFQDKKGGECFLEVYPGDYLFTVKAYCKNLPVGYARCTFASGEVTLADIRVENNFRIYRGIMIQLFNLLHLPCSKTFRSSGIGSEMLNAVIDYSRKIGAKNIRGKMHGNIELLSAWYSNHGFKVDRKSKEIKMHLNDNT